LIEKTLKVTNRLGIHARPAGMIVDITSRAKSSVTIVYEGTKANAKSILNVMMLAITPGSEVAFVIEGEDEATVFAALEKLFADHFHEEDND
jgi:phosphocarrier protein